MRYMILLIVLGAAAFGISLMAADYFNWKPVHNTMPSYVIAQDMNYNPDSARVWSK